MKPNIHFAKIPSARERALGGIAACAMAAALIGGSTGAPATALAADHVYANAEATIVSQANAGATYDAYKVFDADIGADDSATHIGWASEAAKSAVVSFLNRLTGAESYSSWLSAKGYAQSGAGDNAQNAAEFIAERIAADAPADFGSSPTARVGRGFADRLARAVCASPIQKVTTGTDGVVAGTEGYYLIVSTPDTIGVDEGGSAPMWIPLGGSLSAVPAKEAAPSVAFKVKEDKTGAWGFAADANTGQDLEFSIRATVPDNIGAYSRFHDKYAITLPAGMSTAGSADQGADVSTASFKVLVGGADVTPQASISAEGNVVTVDLDDVTALSGAAANRGDVVEITYLAHLNASASLGSSGNATFIERTYTKDPVSLADGKAAVQAVTGYCYQLKMVNVDKSSHEAVVGARYTIEAATDQGDLGIYVQADGSLGANPHVFETDASGEFSVTGIDEGTYVIKEVGVPDGYLAQDADITCVITSDTDVATGSIAIGTRVSGGEAAVLEGDEATRLLSEDAASGLVVVQAAGERSFKVPLTGLQGGAGVYAAALTAGATGASALIVGSRGRRNRNGR